MSLNNKKIKVTLSKQSVPLPKPENITKPPVNKIDNDIKLGDNLPKPAVILPNPQNIMNPPVNDIVNQIKKGLLPIS